MAKAQAKTDEQHDAKATDEVTMTAAEAKALGERVARAEADAKAATVAKDEAEARVAELEAKVARLEADLDTAAVSPRIAATPPPGETVKLRSRYAEYTVGQVRFHNNVAVVTAAQFEALNTNPRYGEGKDFWAETEDAAKAA